MTSMAVADALPPANGSACHPVVTQNTGASVLKGEDVLLVEHQRPWPGCGMQAEPCSTPDGSSTGSARCSCGAATDEYSLFAVFDGHNGVAAARLVADSMIEILEARLPPGSLPAPSSPVYLPWREGIQLALVESLAELNRMFALKGILAGCTATLVLQVGWLLTCANLGDSRAVLDTGCESHMLTVDHRVATHKGERRRVEAMGATIAPIDFSGSGPATRVDNGVGPLRIWPGGLCLSRAIGDFDVGECVIPFPHVMQVMVPPTGGRLLLASDGVWDAYEKMNRVGTMMRGWSIDTLPQRLIQSIVRAYGGLRDDTSLIVVDILPPGGKSFNDVATEATARTKLAAAAASGSGGSGGGGSSASCGCFGSSAPPALPVVEPGVPAAPPPPPPKLTVLADLDVAAVMGLMPECNPTAPGWYDDYVGEQLFALAAEAMEAWQDANERRTGRRPATPQLESSVRAARAAHAVLSGEAELLVDAEGAAWAAGAPGDSGAAGSGGGGGGMRRSGSMFFSSAVAGNERDYAEKFGHYKGAQPLSLSPDPSEGGSTHDASVRPGTATRVHYDASIRGGTAGGPNYGGRVFYGEASVRAGSRFAAEASVRAGAAFYSGPDASVRAGSAGRSGALAAEAAADGTAGAPEGQRNFRADPSIRMGNAALRMLSMSDSASSSDKSLLAAAAEAEDAAAAAGGSGHGRSGGLRRTEGSSGSDGSAPVPMPQPRVSFGAVKVLGPKDAGRPSLQRSDSPADMSTHSNHSGGGYMATIEER